MSPNREALFLKYAQEIRQTYNENSRIPVLATVRREENAQAPDFIKIGKRFLIPQEFFEPNHVIMMRPFADFVELSEFQYVIDVLKQTSEIKSYCDQPPNYRTINTAIESISESMPDFIIIPIAFFTDLHMERDSPGLSLIRYERDNNLYYVGSGGRLRILWSNKYIRLNEMLIGNSRDSLWLFKSNDDGRLRVEFMNGEQFNVSLLVETVFKYRPPHASNISVVEFPERLCQIQS